MYINIREIPAGFRFHKEEGKHNLFVENPPVVEEASGIMNILDVPKLEYSQIFNQCYLHVASKFGMNHIPFTRPPISLLLILGFDAKRTQG